MVRLTGEGWFDQPDVIADLKNHGYEYDKDYIIMTTIEHLEQTIKIQNNE